MKQNTDGSLKKAAVKNDINTLGDIVDFSISYNAGRISEVNSSSTMAMLQKEQLWQERIHRGIWCWRVMQKMQYDQKTNPLYAHRDFLVFLRQGPSKNNAVVENIYDAELTLENRYQYEYTYKSGGFSKQAKRSCRRVAALVSYSGFFFINSKTFHLPAITFSGPHQHAVWPQF